MLAALDEKVTAQPFLEVDKLCGQTKVCEINAQSQIADGGANLFAAMPDKAPHVYGAKRRGPALRLDWATIWRVLIDRHNATIRRAVIWFHPNSSKRNACIFIATKTVALQVCVAAALH